MTPQSDKVESAPLKRPTKVRYSAHEREAFTKLALELSAAENLETLGAVVRQACDRLWTWDAFLLSVRRSGGHAQFRGISLVDTVGGIKQPFAPFNYSASIYARLDSLLAGRSVLINRTGPPEIQPGEGVFGDESRRSMSIIYAPIPAAAQVVGILSIQSYTPGHFSSQDRDRLATVAELIGPAVQRCRAEDHGRAFSSLGYRLSLSHTPESAAEVIVEVADQLLGWDACMVDLYDPQTETLIAVLAKDIVDGERGCDVTNTYSGGPANDFIRDTLLNGAQLILREPGEAPDLNKLQAYGDVDRPSASLMFAPVRVGERVVGLLSIQSYTYNAYTESDLHVLQALADHCGGALARSYTRQKLTESEERHRLLVEHVNDGIVISQNNRFIHFNARFAKMLGYDPEELRQLDYSHLYTPGGLAILAARKDARARGDDPPDRYETVFRHKDGSDVEVEANITIIPNYRGSQATFAVIRDIRERRLQEQKLRASEAELRALFAAMTDVILVLDQTGRYLKVTPTNTSLLVRSPEELLNSTLHDIFPQEQADEFLGLIQKSLAGKCSYSIEYDLEVVDGTRNWFLATVSPINDSEVIWVARDITKRREAEDQVFQTSALYEALIDSSEDYIFVMDRDLRYVRVNSAVRRRYRTDPQARIGKTVTELLGNEQAEFYIGHLRKVFETGEPVRYEDHGILFGKPIYTETVVSPIRGRDGTVDAIVGVSRDITERRVAELALRDSEERYALAMEGANDGLWDWNLRTDQLYLSPRWWAMVGLPGEGHGEVALQDWFNRIHVEDLTRLKAKIAEHVGGDTSHFEDEHRIQHHDGSWRWVLSRGLCVRDTDGTASRMAGSMSDITVRKAAEAELQHGASHDALTGLPNRAYFLECLQKAMARARRRGSEEISSFAVLFLDLDRFKVVNDSLGHLAGDELLVATARRLERCVRPGDTVARLGGDEFTVLLEGIDGSHDATRVAERIGTEVSQSIDVAGYQVQATTSIGIALDAPSYSRPEDLLRDADTAMYRAKAQGRARYQLFDRQMHARALAQLRLETDLRQSIAEERFVLFYQPVVCLRTGVIRGLEALARWQHPNGTLILPSEFIPVAEETGYIVSLGWWLLKQAARQARVWNEGRTEHEQIRISINLSVRQFTQPQLMEKLARILREEQCPHGSLVLEITETMLMDTSGAAKATLESLRALGVGLHVDDFGTGYSSLSYLHHFPLDMLKIDRSFTAAMGADGYHGTEIMKAIMALGHSLGLNVVAEGVETAAQAKQLCDLGCEFAQGFFFYRPMEVEDVTALLAGSAASV